MNLSKFKPFNWIQWAVGGIRAACASLLAYTFLWEKNWKFMVFVAASGAFLDWTLQYFDSWNKKRKDK